MTVSREPLAVGSSKAVDGGSLLHSIWKTVSFHHLGFDEQRGTLETPVCVFLVDGCMVSARVLAALENERDDWI